MDRARSNSKGEFGLLLGLYGLVCLLLVLVIDGSVRTVLDELQMRTLSDNAAEWPRLQRALAELTAEADRLQAEVQRTAGSHIPSANELTQLAAAYDLQLTRMERQQGSGSKPSTGSVVYVTTFRGGATNVVRFLRALEEQYLCAADRVELWPADESGAVVSVQLSVSVREP